MAALKLCERPVVLFDFDGTVAEILVENGEMVEYGQPLFCIK